MGEILDALHRLQEIELQLRDLRRGEERKARQVRGAQRQLRLIEDKTADLKVEQGTRQAEVDNFDGDVSRREESITRHRAGLLEARTNKDYAAILTSINTEKADSAKIEKLALEKLGELERVQTSVDACLQQRDNLCERLESCRGALRDYQDSTADRRSTLGEQRETAAEHVPPGTLLTFTRVAEKHDGEAMAEVLRLHPRREEYACSGCHMAVTLDRVSYLRSRDEVQFCDACERILHLPSNASTEA
jgi:predicted  nucleic acid-binding Zn-ribbon protein